MKILVCNAGFSSLKFSLFEADHESLVAEGSIDWTTKPTCLLFHRAGQQLMREVLKLERHEDAAGRIFEELQAGSEPALARLEDIQESHTALYMAGPILRPCKLHQKSNGRLETLRPSNRCTIQQA
jgi:hypothetical protein